MDSFTRSFLVLLVLLNPFVLSVYLIELVKGLRFRQFANQLARAWFISFVVFVMFAWAGDGLFENVFQVRFFAFLVFGGITFLIIGIRLIVGAGEMAVRLRPDDQDVAVSIAMPLMIGPGTISASVLAGARLSRGMAVGAIALALGVAFAAMLLFKRAHDAAQQRNERLVRLYTEIAGRVTALFTGSFAIDMILRGLEGWIATLSHGH
jgi:small neutral amino acid transporter SnatA (MarC family)